MPYSRSKWLLLWTNSYSRALSSQPVDRCPRRNPIARSTTCLEKCEETNDDFCDDVVIVESVVGGQGALHRVLLGGLSLAHNSKRRIVLTIYQGCIAASFNSDAPTLSGLPVVVVVLQLVSTSS